MKTIRILKSAFSAIIILAVSTICVSAQTPKPNPAAFQRYAQHDIAPRDGWDDNWQKKFPAHTADKNADPDGDGIGNFEEMLDGTDPTRANKKGEIFISADEAARQAEAATKARLEAERIWAERKARLDALAAPEFPAGAAQAAKQQQETVDAVKMQALHNAVAQKEAADKAAAKALLQQKGFPEWLGNHAEYANHCRKCARAEAVLIGALWGCFHLLPPQADSWERAENLNHSHRPAYTP